NENAEARKRNLSRCREKGIILPTFKQMKDPSTIPSPLKSKLSHIGLWEVNPANLFRINWHNEPKEKGGLFGGVNYLEFPKELTGVRARIIALVGKWFPTGAHKVGATYGCLAPALVTGRFDSTRQKAVWPSTGNYCRGGAYNSALLACDSIAILPEEMSKERFEWLKTVAGEVIATPGCESNVKEIFDKCWELRKTRGDDIVIFNQFEEFGNYLWHYEVTGSAVQEVMKSLSAKAGSNPWNLAGFVSSTGSAGTIATGDRLKQLYPYSKIVAAEALQCPTLLRNGFGGHRIEGIGDKHVPWIHNVKNTDFIAAIDDQDCMDILRLFNEEEGKAYLEKIGVPASFIQSLDLIGISGMGNLLASIKFAKYYELTEEDVVFTVLTDSMELYLSRKEELRSQYGPFRSSDAERVYYHSLLKQGIDNVLELGYYDRMRIHNLKYFTWVEQQGKSLTELNEQWYRKDYWTSIQQLTPQIDARIEEFNREVGLL
ncbi:MAG: pyridoxal-phosphate dependent enzyme, partial [Spirochaetales bacterium]